MKIGDLSPKWQFFPGNSCVIVTAEKALISQPLGTFPDDTAGRHSKGVLRYFQEGIPKKKIDPA